MGWIIGMNYYIPVSLSYLFSFFEIFLVAHVVCNLVFFSWGGTVGEVRVERRSMCFLYAGTITLNHVGLLSQSSGVGVIYSHFRVIAGAILKMNTYKERYQRIFSDLADIHCRFLCKGRKKPVYVTSSLSLFQERNGSTIAWVNAPLEKSQAFQTHLEGWWVDLGKESVRQETIGPQDRNKTLTDS